MRSGPEALISRMATAARDASRLLGAAPREQRDAVLRSLAVMLGENQSHLIDANQRDVARAQDAGLSPAMIDRLGLSRSTLASMVKGLLEVADAPDPIGAVTDLKRQPSGIEVGRMRVPIGVIGIIYEARPNVTIDAAALCIKSGNACLLRGGREALETNVALGEMLAAALQKEGLPKAAVQVVDTDDRAVVDAMARATGFIDVIIPRGGRALIERLIAVARVPMIKHLEGVCHVFVDASAKMNFALAIADNAKTQRYGTCNTMETLLVHDAIAARFLPEIAALYRAKGVEMRGDDRAQKLLPGIGAATEDDWRTEYLAPIVAIRVLDSLDDAIAHINHYGSHHTDAIITEDADHTRRFLREVDSASVINNASTRFADGFEFGLGAEIGISNDKLHARGPVGLEGLTSVKYIVYGHGEVRDS
jgi:glutamate-5-semialdehyde dehydrogenase